jgi:hypothetical protein
MMRKALFAGMTMAVFSGMMTLGAISPVSAAPKATITLTGPWGCTQGALTIRFSPALTSTAPNGKNSAVLITGQTTHCTEPANASQSPSALLTFKSDPKLPTGGIRSNCLRLTNAPREYAPDMDGEIRWSAFGGNTFVPSAKIIFTYGSLILTNSKGKLSFSWPAAAGRIQAGSEIGQISLTTGTALTAAQIAAMCRTPTGISRLTLTGSDA